MSSDPPGILPDPWSPYVPPGRDQAVRIRDIRTICTAPDDVTLVVVKVETNEPGLHGLGCATFTQRPLAVVAAVEEYLRPLLVGRDVSDIEDLRQTAYLSSYWRGGPVLNNAVAGVEMALWDIKGKLAGMPVHQLLGGKCREAADVYVHASGRDEHEVEEDVRRFMEAGFRHVRCQVAVPGGSTYGIAAPAGAAIPALPPHLEPDQPRWDPVAYTRTVPRLFEHLRATVGEEVELLHDVHERIPPHLVPAFARSLEPYRLFFLEDPYSLEDREQLRRLRAHTTIPLAMGELFTSSTDYLPPLFERLVDFVRVHLSDVGGIGQARKLAAVAEHCGARTAWHGPPDASPVAHAAHVHLDLACANFGIQEVVLFSDRMREVFPGAPEIRDGAVWPNERPGLGVDLDEQLAAAHPPVSHPLRGSWPPVRLADGSIVTP